MVVDPQWFALAFLTTSINAVVLGFVAWREHDAALGRWALAWGAWAASVAPLALLPSDDSAPLTAVLFGTSWVVSTLAFLSGSYAFAGRHMPRAWYAVAAIAVSAGVVLGVGPYGPKGMFPLVLFQCVGLAATGGMVMRMDPKSFGARVCGGALIILAIHLLDAPILAKEPAWLMWGFVASLGLEMLAALGMLALYYEHARSALLETQRALSETRRIEALGRVAGGVAHDFNNMLTVIGGHVEFMRMHGALPANVEKSVSTIEQAVSQSARLTAQLLAFGRKSVLQPAAIDVQRVVRDALELLDKVMPASIDVRFECIVRGGEPGGRDSEGYGATMDRALLEQIVLNLVTNARDAIDGAGVIDVRLSRLEGEEPRLLLSVSDTGRGMDESVLKRVFEPFFTTKDEGRGTGLGLASVQGAVSQLGGAIRVQSRPGQGSTFEVSLPCRAAAASAVPVSSPPAVGVLDVLVVDDDSRVRQVVATMLQRAGHRVEQAADGVEALEAVAKKRYHLVLSDVDMPRMGGVELSEVLSTAHPDTLVVLTSGNERATAACERVRFVAKPFRGPALVAQLAGFVAERRGSLQREA